MINRKGSLIKLAATEIPTADEINALSDADYKVYENRMRRMAQRQGLRLAKSRRRDVYARGYRTYMLVDVMTSAVVAGNHENGYGLGLDDVERALTTRDFDEGQQNLLKWMDAKIETDQDAVVELDAELVRYGLPENAGLAGLLKHVRANGIFQGATEQWIADRRALPASQRHLLDPVLLERP